MDTKKDEGQVKEAGCDTMTPDQIQANNHMMLDRITASAEGEVKEASTAGTNMIRRRIREEGFTRKIIPPQTVTNEDLDRVLEHDRPVIIEDMEPLSKGAKSIPFGDSADTQFYYGNKYAVVFNPITTPEWTKDINELRTYRMDLRQVITDNSLKDIQTEEDGKFIAMVDTIVGSTAGLGAAGVQQNFNISGGITRDTYVELLSKLEDQNLNNGIVLMNRRTAKEFLKFDRSEIGGDLAQDLLKQGLTALQEATIFGVKHIFTIKRNLVPRLASFAIHNTVDMAGTDVELSCQLGNHAPLLWRLVIFQLDSPDRRI
ncbi:MAG: hypothetical protein AAB370_10990 [Verrucomicrobiota bacterium]